MGVAEPGKGGGREVRAKPPPQLLTEPEIPAERRRERQRASETHAETESYTQPERGAGHTYLGMDPPTHTQGGQEAVIQEIKLVFPASSVPASLLNHFFLQYPPHSFLTCPFSLQSSRKGFWTGALPQDRIPLWWKVAGAV